MKRYSYMYVDEVVVPKRKQWGEGKSEKRENDEDGVSRESSRKKKEYLLGIGKGKQGEELMR